ncbi:hypothetical protein DL768_006510 [Monosporascus sp. mg162]|nr:hypothetical protein DL768_006510 [Monosporascus sp. mg162]
MALSVIFPSGGLEQKPVKDLETAVEPVKPVAFINTTEFSGGSSESQDADSAVKLLPESDWWLQLNHVDSSTGAGATTSRLGQPDLVNA